MTLNASGPISLGGSTVGQSVNLELGQAATATTSLNATNVRTLLQVPSGQISLSNAYGKSNATAFIVSLGLQNAGSTGVTTVPIRSYGWMASPSGVTAWKMGGFTYAGFMSADGTTFTSVNYDTSGPRNSFFAPTQNKYTTASVFPLCSSINNRFFLLSSTNSYNPPITTMLGTSEGGQGTPPFAYSLDSSGNISWMTNANESKYGYYFVIGKFTLSGTNVKILQLTNYQAGIPYDAPKRLLQRTDGTYLAIWGTTTTVYYRVINSALTSNTSAQSISCSLGGVIIGMDLDSSNNLYIYSRFGQVVKANTSGTVLANYTYSAVGEGWASSFGQQGAFGISIYNDVLYIATNGIANNSSSATGLYLNIIAISCSSMTALWNKQFYFGGNEVRPMCTYAESFAPGQANGIQATSAGLYVAFTVGSGVSGEVFCMNLPLTVGISNQTTNIALKSGGSITMTVTSPTNTTSVLGSTSTGSFTAYPTGGTPSQASTANWASANYSPGISGTKTTVPV